MHWFVIRSHRPTWTDCFCWVFFSFKLGSVFQLSLNFKEKCGNQKARHVVSVTKPLARSWAALRRSDSEAQWEIFGEGPRCCVHVQIPHLSRGVSVFCQLFTTTPVRPFFFSFSLFCAHHVVCLSPQLAWEQAVQRGLRFHSSGPGNGPTPCRLTPTPSRPDRKSSTYLTLFAGAHSNKRYRSLCVVAGHLWIFDSSES